MTLLGSMLELKKAVYDLWRVHKYSPLELFYML